ncbi:MAG: DUF2169 domain-containing protein [Polyangiaceae bacterium]|nr:DUF2169 domain-containing protein [Polyangiaceae bacterium]
MDVVSRCALRASGFEWQPRPGTHAFTVVCKGTFLLRPETAVLAPQQDPPNDEDEHWNDDTTRSVRVPSDRVPYKPAVDVVLVGSAFSPQLRPVRSFHVRLSVGPLDKRIEVWCERSLRVHDDQLKEGPRITKMHLRWERAAGGPDTQNPTGMRFDAPPDRYGVVPIPNLQPPGVHFAGGRDLFPPVGYGPIAPNWPSRVMRLHRHAAAFYKSPWEGRPLPDDFDYSFFNSAPPDQQIAEIAPGERILLENLHAEHSHLVTSLPNVFPNMVATRATGEREVIAIGADTLYFDTDRGICCVVWRGRIGLRHPGEAGRIDVTMDSLASTGETIDEAVVHTIAPGMITDDILPFGGRVESARPTHGSAQEGGLPFGRDSREKVSDRLPPTEILPDNSREATSELPAMGRSNPVATPPLPAFVRGPEPVAPPLIGAIPPQGAPIAPIAPPLAVPLVSLATPPPPAQSIGQRAVEGLGADGKLGTPAIRVEPSKPVAVEPVEKPLPVKDAAVGGLVAASNAAAAGARPAGRWYSGKAPVELLWLNAAAMGRIRKHGAWKELLSGLKPRPEDEDLDDDLPPARRFPARDRREILTILSRGEPSDVTVLEDILAQSMDDEDGFTPPLVLAAGELEMRFDELELLKATLAAIYPLAAGEKSLKMRWQRRKKCSKCLGSKAQAAY